MSSNADTKACVSCGETFYRHRYESIVFFKRKKTCSSECQKIEAEGRARISNHIKRDTSKSRWAPAGGKSFRMIGEAIGVDRWKAKEIYLIALSKLQQALRHGEL